MSLRPTLSLAALAAMLALSSQAQAATSLCSDTITASATVLSNGFGFNASNTRNQASSITAANVATLQLAFTHVAEGTLEKRAAPAITNQVVYMAEGRDLVAVNRLSGCEYWRYGVVNKSTPLVGSNAIRSSSITYLPATLLKPAMVFAGDFYGNYYAVNARSGAVVWNAFMGADTANNFITGSAQIHNGTMFIPVATKEVITTVLNVPGNCCKSHGLLQAVDPYTGKIKWTYQTSANALYDWSTGFSSPNGMSIWGTPAIDTANNAVIFGTGQNLSQPATHNSDSVISVNASTGKVNWVFQGTAGDAWNAACQAPAGLDSHCSKPEGKDFDFGAPPIVATLPNGTKAIIAGQKSGVVYSLNPKTGKPNWSKRLGVGGSLGGIHWGMAIDKARVYVGVTDIYVDKLQRLALTDLLNVTAASAAAMAPEPGATPGLYALDLATGNLVWEKHLKHTYATDGKAYDSLFSAALTITNDVLLAGNLNGELKAFRSSTGEELWSYNTAVGVVDVNGVAGNGGTIDSVGPVIAGKDVYLNSGYNTFGSTNAWQAGSGNALFVFRLP